MSKTLAVNPLTGHEFLRSGYFTKHCSVPHVLLKAFVQNEPAEKIQRLKEKENLQALLIVMTKSRCIDSCIFTIQASSFFLHYLLKEPVV